jgi:hypothetical protein
MNPSLFKVLKTEPVNGVTAANALKYGLVNTVTDPKDGTRIFVRMSKFLLRVALGQTLETLGILQATMPKGIELSSIFRTCRTYMDKTQEVVQVVSLIVTYFVLLLVESPPPLSLASLRPGALILGDEARAHQELKALAKASENVRKVVQRAGYENSTEKLNQWRTEAAKHTVKLVPPVDEIAPPNTAALFLSKVFPGFDIWTCFGMHVYLGQCKGVLKPAGDDRKVTYSSEAKVWLEKMFQAFEKKIAMPTGCACLGFELLVARPVSANCLKRMRQQLSGTNSCIVFISKAELKTALGPIFGGIAARCSKNGDK